MTLTTEDAKWFCVLTAANREADACVNLRRQGYGVFFPRQWITFSHRGHTTSTLRPLLSRYIFASIGSGLSVGAMNDTDGVSRVLTMCGEAYELPRETMRYLRREFGEDGVQEPGPETLKHLSTMLQGLDIGVAARLLSALGRIDDRWSYSAGTAPDRRRKRASRSKRLRPVTEPALDEEPQIIVEAMSRELCLVRPTLPALRRTTAEPNLARGALHFT